MKTMHTMLWIMLLSACSSVVDIMPAPFIADFPACVQNFETHTPNYIPASDGIQLAYYDFIAPAPIAVMIFYHAAGAWSNQLYQHMAHQLACAHNITMYLFDIRGHGNSRGPRGDAPSSEQVWRDVNTAIDFVRARHRTTPLFLGGHSSGAGLLLNHAYWYEPATISGYVFISPFLGIFSDTMYEHDDPANQLTKKIDLVAIFLSRMTGGWCYLNKPVVFLNHSAEHKQQEPQLLDYFTSAMAIAITPENPKKIFNGLTKPFLLLMSGKDEQFIPHKVTAFHQHAHQVKSRSISQIVPHATHLSIMLDTPAYLQKYWKKLGW